MKKFGKWTGYHQLEFDYCHVTSICLNAVITVKQIAEEGRVYKSTTIESYFAFSKKNVTLK